jgi:hypothetical protein
MLSILGMNKNAITVVSWMNTQLYPAFSSYYFWGELQEISWKKMTQFATLLRRLFELFVH